MTPDFLVLDYETTGTDPARCAPLQVGLAAFQLRPCRVVASASLLVASPAGCPLPARRVHGLDGDAGLPAHHALAAALSWIRAAQPPVLAGPPRPQAHPAIHPAHRHPIMPEAGPHPGDPRPRPGPYSPPDLRAPADLRPPVPLLAYNGWGFDFRLLAAEVVRHLPPRDARDALRALPPLADPFPLVAALRPIGLRALSSACARFLPDRSPAHAPPPDFRAVVVQALARVAEALPHESSDHYNALRDLEEDLIGALRAAEPAPEDAPGAGWRADRDHLRLPGPHDALADAVACGHLAAALLGAVGWGVAELAASQAVESAAWAREAAALVGP